MSRVVDRSSDLGEYIPAVDDNRIICRCEEITKGEIRQAIHDGMFNVTEIRRFLRTGMGLCQGQTCGKLVRAIIANELGENPSAIAEATARSPMRPVKMQAFAKEVNGL